MSKIPLKIHLDAAGQIVKDALNSYVQAQSIEEHEKVAISHGVICMLYHLSCKQYPDPFKDLK